MSFDDDPEDYPNYPCPKCDGVVSQVIGGRWVCETIDCDFMGPEPVKNDKEFK